MRRCSFVAMLLLACRGCLAADPVLTIVSYSAGSVPSLAADRAVELLAGSTVVLNCQGDRNISWSTPDVVTSGMLLPQSRFSPGRAVPSGSEVAPGCNVAGASGGSSCHRSSNITLSGLKYNDIGRIECSYADGQSQEQAFVFLLVNDATFLRCLPVSTSRTLIIKQNDTLVVPCISTSNRMTPSLIQSAAVAQYSRQRGIIIEQAVPSKVFTRVQCKCSNDFIVFPLKYEVQPNPPQIASKTGPDRRTFFVGEGVELECSLMAATSAAVNLSWIFLPTLQAPADAVPRNMTTNQVPGGYTAYELPLVFRPVELRHSGTYHCKATSASGNLTASLEFELAVVDKPFVKFVDSSELTLEVDQLSSPELVVRFEAVPPPTAGWVFGNDSNQLSNNETLAITSDSKGDMYTQTLSIKSIGPSQSGIYSVLVQVGTLSARRSISLVVNVNTAVSVVPSNYIDVSVPLWSQWPPQQPQQQTLKCTATGVPEPVLSWSWQSCHQPGCSERADAWADLAIRSYLQNSPNIVLSSSRESQVTIVPRHSGLYRCTGTNRKGSNASHVVRLIVHDGPSKLYLVNQSQQLLLAVGEAASFTCYANKWMVGSPNFFRKAPGSNEHVPISGGDRCCIFNRSMTNRSNVLIVAFNATLNSTASYGCEADNLTVGKLETTGTIQVNVREAVPPSLVVGLPVGPVTVKAGSAVRLYCVASGFPRPLVKWFKDGQLLFSSPGGISLSPDGSNMTIERPVESDRGTYECVASSQFGTVSSNTTLVVTVLPSSIARLSDTNIAIVVVIIVVIIAASVIATVFLVRRFCRKKAIPHEFLLPSKNMLNPDIPLDEQTECLPYDAEWEFPRDSLKFGMVLGQGAFGRVIKADAFNIEPGVAVTTVAVKTVRDPDDIEQIKALISELKILIHLGQHLNIVNLLGAVTRRLKRGELYVIVEYCRFGNLRSYLLKHKQHFADVLDAEGERSLAARLSSRRSVGASVSGGGGGADASDDYLNSSSRSQMHCEENPLTTLDLLYWSFQICRGMQYLASIQYIHRDLAARNVLLADDNIVKICDFGLAKDIYKYHEYRKKTDGPLPIKWMALESLTHKLFTTASDVWSFGITLWELFSLAGTPYPGVELNEAFLEKLQAGYRMEQPKHAPDNIYKIMLKCWHPDASKRPTFADLSFELRALLEAPVRDHYLALEEPYTQKRDARDDYPPHYGGKAGAAAEDSRDSDYLPVISSVHAAPEAAGASSDQSPSDYYNIGKPKPPTPPPRADDAAETTATERGTAAEKVPLSKGVALDDDAYQDVFEGEDMPLPSCVAPLPNAAASGAEDSERYTKAQWTSKVPAAAGMDPGPKAARKEDRQMLLPQRVPAATAASASGRTGGTTETAI